MKECQVPEIWSLGHLEAEEKACQGEAPRSCQELWLVGGLESKVKIRTPVLELGQNGRGWGI